MDTKRILSLDYMKALAIFFVVLGHLIDGIDSSENTFRAFIYSLHLPLFFIVSGFLSCKKLTSFSEIKKWYGHKLRLLIPFVVFSIGDILLLHREWEGYLGWNKFGLWFLWTLFLFDSIYALTQCLLLRNHSKWVENCVLLIPVFLCIALRKFDDTLVGGIFNFMQLYNYIFFILGVIVARYNLHNFVLDERVQLGMLLVYILGLSTRIGALNIPMKACGILLVYGMFEALIKAKNNTSFGTRGGVNSMILSIGRRSLYIYTLHFYFIQGILQLPDYMHDVLFRVPFAYLTVYSFFSIVIILACVFLADLLDTNKYIRKYVFGSRK